MKTILVFFDTMRYEQSLELKKARSETIGPEDRASIDDRPGGDVQDDG